MKLCVCVPTGIKLPPNIFLKLNNKAIMKLREAEFHKSAAELK